MADDLRQILTKLEQIENRLNTIERRRAPEPISAEELQAYAKVRDLVAWSDETTCGINETSPCIIRRCWWFVPPRGAGLCIPQRCDVECVCGPCNIGGGAGGGVGRFGGLGG
jgi:hypothetical protein